MVAAEVAELDGVEPRALAAVGRVAVGGLGLADRGALLPQPLDLAAQELENRVDERQAGEHAGRLGQQRGAVRVPVRSGAPGAGGGGETLQARSRILQTARGRVAS